MDSKAGVKASAKASAKARAAAGAKQGTRAEPGLAAEALGRPSIKLIVSNRAALLRKYKTSGLASIRKAVAALAKADKARGIKTQLLFLDDAAAMKALAAPAVKTAAGPREIKAAIDAVCKALQPAWLMILGAPDVLPHQDLDNPAASPPDDPDLRAWGDLPYACDAPYSRDPARFVGPTRVVGRLFTYNETVAVLTPAVVKPAKR
jgi:hypothetical protein